MQDLNDKITGDTLTAAEFVQPMSELQNVIEATGQTLSSGDLNQLGKGIAEYAASGAFYTDSGAADAYVLTAVGGKQAPAAYADGQTFTFVTANPNTGASTANPAGLGVKNIKLADGTDPGAGAINGRTTLYYDLGNDHLELKGRGAPVLQVFTTSGTYTPTVGVKFAKLTAVGGGGGGGSAASVGGETVATKAGAGAGAAIQTFVPSGTYTVTVGAGGAGGAGTDPASDGANGGDTIVSGTGVAITCTGGGLGVGRDGVSGTSYELLATQGSTATGGDYQISGTPAGRARLLLGDRTDMSTSGYCPLFGGGKIPANAVAGVDGTQPGEGGGSIFGGLVTAKGGDGFRGEVRVEEFF